jgi:hypothetical protein
MTDEVFAAVTEAYNALVPEVRKQNSNRRLAGIIFEWIQENNSPGQTVPTPAQIVGSLNTVKFNAEQEEKSRAQQRSTASASARSGLRGIDALIAAAESMGDLPPSDSRPGHMPWAVAHGM